MTRRRLFLLAAAIAAVYFWVFGLPFGPSDRIRAQGATEADLLRELQQPRTAFLASLDLAILYRDQRRTGEAEQMLNRAIRVLRNEQQPRVGGPSAPPPPPAAPLRIGGDIKEPRKTRDVRPVYPASARATRLSGSVLVEFVIDKTGAVTDVRVLRSSPPFDAAALEAVRGWRYEPPLLNGIPVPVVTTAVVDFRP